MTIEPVDDTIFTSLQERSIGGGLRHQVGRCQGHSAPLLLVPNVVILS